MFGEPPREEKAGTEGCGAEIEGELPALDPEIFPPGGEHPALAPVDPRDFVIRNLPGLERRLDGSVELQRGGLKVFDRVGHARKGRNRSAR